MFGTITILVGILGIFGVFKKKYWVICAFYISSSIIAITLIVLGCIINNFANNEYQQIKNDKNCTGNEFQWLLYANLACNSA